MKPPSLQRGPAATPTLDFQVPAGTAKPRLLVVELWGLGDLVIATPFLRAASEKFAVTVLAKPYAEDLQTRFWPEATVVSFVAPWTAFKGKYRLYAWPWIKILRLRGRLSRQFDVALSARWDPRDHLLMWLAGAKIRMGFPRMRSQMFLTHPLARPYPLSHRYESWRILGRNLGLELPAKDSIPLPPPHPEGEILVHSGAGQPVRVWPLERYRSLVARLRQAHYRVQVACDPDQQTWWHGVGETAAVTPRSVKELFGLIDRAGVFLGNDSGPAHLAALSGVPTFILFGPQLPEWFAPLHPEGEWIEGKPCPYKPCSDYCRFAVPHCMLNISEEEVWTRFSAFLARRLRVSALAL